MSSSVDGATSARIPSQAYGYSRSQTLSASSGMAGPADAVEAVAPGDDVAAQLALGAVVAVADHRLVVLEPLDGHVLALEQQRRAVMPAGPRSGP